MTGSQLTNEQIGLREKARELALEEILPVSKKYDKTGSYCENEFSSRLFARNLVSHVVSSAE